MRLKVYQAPNMGAAMAMVRDELGPDALILANRTIDGGVELTAAREDAPAPAAITTTPVPPLPAPLSPAPLSPVSALPVPISPAEIGRVGTLRWHGVPAEIATRLHRGNLAEALRTRFRFGSLPCRSDDPPLLLVGPPGAGKTLTTARLATRLKLAGQPSMVITADGRRAGAAEQLAAFTRLLELTLIVADQPQQLARSVLRRSAAEPVLVDMPGLDPFDPADRDFLRECRASLGAEVALVLPAGLDPADAEEIAAGFRDAGAAYLIATRLDQSRRLGGILAAAGCGLSLTDAGIGPGVADGLVALTPELLGERLLLMRERDAAPAASPPSALALLARARTEQPRSSP